MLRRARAPVRRRPRRAPRLRSAAPWLALAAMACDPEPPVAVPSPSEPDARAGAAGAGADGPAGAAGPTAPPRATEPQDRKFVAAKTRAQLRAAIRADEVVELFPVDVVAEGPGRWTVDVHGWIYEPETQSHLRKLFVSELEALLELADEDVQSERFTRRLAPFLVDNERAKQIDVIVGDQIVRSRASGPNGHFFARVTLGPRDLMRAHDGELGVRAVTAKGDPREFVGRAHVVDPGGVLLISDLDDTVKVSDVHDKRLLLRHTFLDEFEIVPGLAAKYVRWLGADGHLHFVSSTPWQLQAQLDEALRAAGYPPASYSLKTVRLKDPSVLDLFADPEQAKPLAIEAELARHPNTTVVLVGDSGERDPEIYGAVARRHPDRIRRIFIRDVTAEGPDATRWSTAFEGVTPGTWRVFRDAAELPDTL